MHRNQQRIEIVGIELRFVEIHARNHVNDIENTAQISGRCGAVSKTGSQVSDCAGDARELHADALHGACSQIFEF
jgi:hypothetical protein